MMQGCEKCYNFTIALDWSVISNLSESSFLIDNDLTRYFFCFLLLLTAGTALDSDLEECRGFSSVCSSILLIVGTSDSICSFIHETSDQYSSRAAAFKNWAV
jgi:hypothetical protein